MILIQSKKNKDNDDIITMKDEKEDVKLNEDNEMRDSNNENIIKIRDMDDNKEEKNKFNNRR